MTKTSDSARVEREARLRWVPVAKMSYFDFAQREKTNWARVHEIAANFDLEQLGTPTVNERDGVFYLLDGAHRVEALKEIGYGDQQVQCWAYSGLSDAEMAEVFLKLNDTLAVSAMDKFRVGVNAGREEECDIDRIVRAQGLHVSRDRGEGAIRAVGTLRRIYRRGGPSVLARTLGIVRDAYGSAGFESVVVDGIGLLVQRYGTDLDVPTLVQRLSNTHGGVNGLLGRAAVLRKQTGTQVGHCVAAAAVDIMNAGRGGKKLPSWWREDATPVLRSA